MIDFGAKYFECLDRVLSYFKHHSYTYIKGRKWVPKNVHYTRQEGQTLDGKYPVIYPRINQTCEQLTVEDVKIKNEREQSTRLNTNRRVETGVSTIKYDKLGRPISSPINKDM